MRVLHLFYLDLLRNRLLDKRLSKKVRLTVVLHKRHFEDYVNLTGNTSEILPLKFHRPIDPRNIVRLVVLRRYISKVRPDVILYQPDHWANIIGVMGWHKVPKILMLFQFKPTAILSRFNPLWWFNQIDSYLRRLVSINSADEILVSSKSLAAILSKMFPKKARHLHYVPMNEVPYILESGPDVSILRSVPKDAKIVLMFGRIAKYKGVNYLIDAQPLITKAVPEAMIVIAGQGNLKEQLKRIEATKSRFILFNRALSDGEAAALYQRADVVALPYTNIIGTSGVIPVAYAYEKPVVVTNVLGLSDQVVSGETGLIVSRENHSALAQAIIRILSDRELHQYMRLTIRKRNADAWDKLLNAYLEIFEESLQRKRPRTTKDKSAGELETSVKVTTPQMAK